MPERNMTFAVIGLDHRHAYGMTGLLKQAGATLAGYLDAGEDNIVAGFQKRFPDARAITEKARILEDPNIQAVVIAAAPSERAALSIEAMRHGKDVMIDKPGCISLDELERIRACAAETGRIWSIDFSERFEVPAVTRASAMVADGRIGRVIQTLGIGPHRLNAATRPEWFFESSTYGGILTDIASHQIDQFLHFTGVTDPTITHASTANLGHPEYPGFEDFGEVNLSGEGARGYVRVDWFTPDALPNWGDGRLFLLGTEGYIELRKYVDPTGRTGTDHLILCNDNTLEYVDCSGDDLPYFGQFIDDVLDRTETAGSQSHTFRVMHLAIESQVKALAASGTP